MAEVENPEWITRRGYHAEVGTPRRFMSAQKLPSASPEAIDTMRKSQLTNKVRPFHLEFISTVSKVEDKANTLRLANQVYGKKDEDIEKRLSSSLSKSRKKSAVLLDLKSKKVMTLSKIDSGLSAMRLFDNLSSKTFQVPTYNEYILQLGDEKKDLNRAIAELKVKISTEAKKRAKLNIQCSKHMNGIEKYNDLLYKNDIELKRIELQQTECQEENRILDEDIQRTEERVREAQKCAAEESELIAGLRTYIRQKKHGIIQQDKLLNDVKYNLTKQLKIMGSCINEIRYSESEKAKVLLHIRDMTHTKPEYEQNTKTVRLS